MSRKHALSSTMTRAKKLRKYLWSPKAKPEPEIIDMSQWRIGGFRTDFRAHDSDVEDEDEDADVLVDGFVLISEDVLVVSDDWESLDKEGASTSVSIGQPSCPSAISLNDGLSSDDASLGSASRTSESHDAPDVLRFPFADLTSNPLAEQQEQEWAAERRRRIGEAQQLESFVGEDASSISEGSSLDLDGWSGDEDEELNHEHRSASSSATLRGRPPD